MLQSQTLWWCCKHYNLLLCETHHVVPEGTSHQRLCPLAKVEAIRTKEGAVGTAILNRNIHQVRICSFRYLSSEPHP